MTNFRNMRGGRNTDGFIELISKLHRHLTVVEVGTYAGESAELLLKSRKVKQLYCVDRWQGAEWEEAEKHARKRLEGYSIVEIIKDTSVNASKRFKDKSIDFIYIDANHSYEDVKEDIKMWLPKIKKGGFIGGHDYNYKFLGVIRAVHENFDRPDWVFMDSSWLVKIK